MPCQTCTMKYFFLAILLTSFTAYGQTKPSQTKSKAVATSKTFKKQLTEDKKSYLISDLVKIENGKEEDVPVTFTVTVDKAAWDQLIKDKLEPDYFELIASMLAIKAKFTLDNNLSFEPFKKQSMKYIDGVFTCDFKMMGRNGYGNMVETSTLVKCDPENLGKF
jgi:hypothetical protein